MSNEIDDQGYLVGTKIRAAWLAEMRRAGLDDAQIVSHLQSLTPQRVGAAIDALAKRPAGPKRPRISTIRLDGH